MPEDRCHARISGPADDLGEPSSDNGDVPYDQIPRDVLLLSLPTADGLILAVMRITFQWCSS